MKDVAVRKSKKHGKGAFANRSFRKGETVLLFLGDIYDARDMPSLLNDLSCTGEADRYIQVSETKFIGPFRDGRDPHMRLPDNWANHSCSPNCSYVGENESGFRLVARRPISRGEEITYDYSTSMIFDSWKMRCTCGCRECRKVITEFRLLPRPLRARYVKEKAIPSFFLKYVRPDGSLRKRAVF